MTTPDKGRPSLSALGQAADLLNEQLRRADRMIREMGFGVFAQVPLVDETGKEVGAMAFGKRSDRWGMYVMMANGQELDITATSIKVRVLSAHQVPALIAALCHAHKNRCVDLQADGAKLRDYLDKLESLGGHLDVPEGPLAKKPEPPGEGS